MINYAHRGASGDYPENTLLAFEEAIKLGARGIEFDVHKTKDQQLVIIHDEDIERTFKGKGQIKDLTLAQLRAYKCRKFLFKYDNRCLIPTLEDVLKLAVHTDILLNIELKTDVIHYEGIEADVHDLVKKYCLQRRVLISSFNVASLQRFQALDATIKTGYLYKKPRPDVIEYAKSLNVSAIHPSIAYLKPELVKQAQEQGLAVNVYTANSPKQMRKLIGMNVDGIFTDYPALFNEIVNGEVHESC